MHTRPGFPGLLGFNSILVRLKALTLSTTDTDIRAFQFHTGSIKSTFTYDKAVGDFVGFNSILVRLKVAIPLTGIGKSLSFQFHTGSIKSESYEGPEIRKLI